MAIDYNGLKGPQRGVLRGTLLEVFRESGQVDVFLQDHGFKPLNHYTPERERLPDQMFDLIGELQRRGHLNRFVDHVKDEFAENIHVAELDVSIGLTADRPGSKLERIVRDGGFNDPYLWTERFRGLMRQVCRISYPNGNGHVRGSGFLVGEDLVLTNWHVVEDLQAKPELVDGVRVTFGYLETAEGPEVGETFRLVEDGNWRVASSPRSGTDSLDFALVRLSGKAGASRHLGVQRRWVSLEPAVEPPAAGAIVFVLQHPGGTTQKFSPGVVLAPAPPMRIRYDADTDGGSSGGLVLNPRLEPVALHQGSDPNTRTAATYNEGIPLQLIAAAIGTDRLGASAG